MRVYILEAVDPASRRARMLKLAVHYHAQMNLRKSLKQQANTLDRQAMGHLGQVAHVIGEPPPDPKMVVYHHAKFKSRVDAMRMRDRDASRALMTGQRAKALIRKFRSPKGSIEHRRGDKSVAWYRHFSKPPGSAALAHAKVRLDRAMARDKDLPPIQKRRW